MLCKKSGVPFKNKSNTHFQKNIKNKGNFSSRSHGNYDIHLISLYTFAKCRFAPLKIYPVMGTQFCVCVCAWSHTLLRSAVCPDLKASVFMSEAGEPFKCYHLTQMFPRAFSRHSLEPSSDLVAPWKQMRSKWPYLTSSWWLAEVCRGRELLLK